jgi:hypothetical protein
MSGPYNINDKVDASQLDTAATADSVAQRTSDGSLNAVNVFASGNVGIGTSTPLNRLVVGDASHGVAVDYVGVSALPAIAGLFTDTGVNGGQGYGSLQIKSRSDFAGYSINFFTASSANLPTERMRIDSSGNVGIGTTTTLGSLDVARSGSHSVVVRTTSTGDPSINLQADGQNNGLIAYSRSGEALTFSNSDSERMRIDSSGNVGIGTSDPSTRRLFVAGGVSGSHMAEFQNTLTSGSLFGPLFQFNSSPNDTSSIFLNCADSTAVRMTVYSNGNIVNQNNSYGAISDVKLKENIEPASPKLDKLMQVEVVKYNLIGDEQKQIGVVAQQLEQVFPSLVQESDDFEKVQVPQLDEDGEQVLDEEGNPVLIEESQPTGTKTKSVKYSVFVPILIKAMQEQQTIIDDLKARIEALEG